MGDLRVNGAPVWDDETENERYWARQEAQLQRRYFCDVEGLKKLYAEDKISTEELERELELTLPDADHWGDIGASGYF